MALIIKGDTNIVSKEVAKGKAVIESEKQMAKGLDGMTPARTEIGGDMEDDMKDDIAADLSAGDEASSGEADEPLGRSKRD
jgi:hypothetical protein